MATATVSRRPRISDEFLKANTCERVVTGTAKVIAEKGYCAATVADIVKATRTARNTFYDCFGGKEEAALALVAALDIDLEQISESPALDVLAIEVAAMHHAGEPERAREYIVGAEKTIRFFAEADLLPPPPSDDPHEGTLPPGRHGLDREFVRANQRARLVSSAAAAITERGFGATRISDVCKGAAVSRRTFYEHFRSLTDTARAMVKARAAATDLLDGVNPDSGLFAVSVEVLAERLCSDGDSPLARKALICVGALSTVGSS